MKRLIRCPECGTTYRVEDERLASREARVSCRHCGHRWLLKPGADPPPTQAAPSPSAAADRPRPAPERRPQPAEARWPSPCSALQPIPGRPGEALCPHCGQTVGLPAAEERPPAAESRLDGSRPVLLLVDDKQLFIDFTREALGEDYSYLTARTTTEALEKLERWPVDLVILDLKLENGPRDGHLILSRRRKKDVPVLVLSGERNSDLLGADWKELESLGARDFIEKGLHIREALASKVKALLGGR